MSVLVHLEISQPFSFFFLFYFIICLVIASKDMAGLIVSFAFQTLQISGEWMETDDELIPELKFKTC